MTDNDSPLLEICVDNAESIRNAVAGGANRLELCSALSEGGLTPSLGLASLAKRTTGIPVFAMLRIRGGDFVYGPEEIAGMLVDINQLKSVGIDGFVFGALTASGEIDRNGCSQIVREASPLPVTFHRAFDEVTDPFLALEVICQLGFTRILTSGCARRASDNTELIRELLLKAQNRLIVMPGAGLTPDNVAELRQRTGAREFHGSASKYKTVDKEGIAHSPVKVTDSDIVRLMLKNLKT